jgi:hypothetical protein
MSQLIPPFRTALAADPRRHRIGDAAASARDALRQGDHGCHAPDLLDA